MCKQIVGEMQENIFFNGSCLVQRLGKYQTNLAEGCSFVFNLGRGMGSYN